MPEGASSAHMVLGQVPHYAVKPGTLVWTDAEPLGGAWAWLEQGVFFFASFDMVEPLGNFLDLYNCQRSHQIKLNLQFTT